jgi:armadillo repeat-containing protein 8
MARVHLHPILAQLRNSRSYADQLSALRTLKSETVGHLQKKERWVELGVLEPIVALLEENRPPAKLNGKSNSAGLAATRPLADDEVVRLQALEVLAIFASGAYI